MGFSGSSRTGLSRGGGTQMPSFDVVSRVDMQELDNAVNMVRKEVAQRYDFRGSKAELELDRKEGAVSFLTEDEMKLRALREMLLALSLIHISEPTRLGMISY